MPPDSRRTPKTRADGTRADTPGPGPVYASYSGYSRTELYKLAIAAGVANARDGSKEDLIHALGGSEMI